MQHIVHIFIGDELAPFRDRFSSFFRRLHPDMEPSLMTSLLMTVESEGTMTLTPDKDGDVLDRTTVSGSDSANILFNFFENMYSRKVTVAHPGNRSLVVILWTTLYSTKYKDQTQRLIEGIAGCTSRIYTEVTGFTHDTVSSFIPDHTQRLAPHVYQECFADNIAMLKELRPRLSAVRLIADRNMDNVALGFNEDALARVSAEFAAMLCEHYLTLHHPVIDTQTLPFESFGISSVIFDRQYFHDYMMNRVVADIAQSQGVDNRRFSINGLAHMTDPVLRQTVDEIQRFYKEQVAHAAANLAMTGSATSSNIVGTIDSQLKAIVEQLKKRIDALIASGSISVFESEAMLKLILGDDCKMFDTSAIGANELTIDGMLDNSVHFFLEMDRDNEILTDVSLKKITEVRTKMRNIAVANRQREEQLAAIESGHSHSEGSDNHISGDEYRFKGVGYKLNLDIDSEPLEITYKAHEPGCESVDLRSSFGPVRNQGIQGSCASFAVASVVESMRGNGQRFSPSFLYWWARDINGTTTYDSGASLYHVIKAATDKGLCEESLMPYDAASFTQPPSADAINAAADCRVMEAQTVEVSLDAIKSALCDGYPVIVAARIFNSFADTRKGFIRLPSSADLATGERSDGHGNHSMVICGFSDTERVFVVRNSWGTEFGDGGYCYMPYSYAKQYILQACIITRLSSHDSRQADTSRARTLEFNRADREIDAAILRNLISEDNEELDKLAAESARLRAAWSHNMANRGNVNNQKTLIDDTISGIKEAERRERSRIAELQATKNDKIREYRKENLKAAVISVIAAVIAVSIALMLPTSLIAVTTAIILSLIAAAAVGTFAWKMKVYRQSLIDDIQRASYNADRIREKARCMEIESHIHNSIIRELGDYRLKLQKEAAELSALNDGLVALDKDARASLRRMTPEVPYPFLSVLSNASLDRYYDVWKDRILQATDIRDIYSHIEPGTEIADAIRHNPVIREAILRGLNNFSMREYITRSHPEKYQFLPPAANISEIIPELDSRATPFYPYNPADGNSTLEKYIFIKQITPQDIQLIDNCFMIRPMPVSTTDPDSISIINIVRFDI